VLDHKHAQSAAEAVMWPLHNDNVVAWPRLTVTLLNGDTPTCHNLVGGYVSLPACGGTEVPQAESAALGA
jgi:hypothetical protein